MDKKDWLRQWQQKKCQESVLFGNCKNWDTCEDCPYDVFEED
jgi:hypothetical protein